MTGIEVKNLDRTIDALRIIDPALKKDLNRQMVGSVKPILDKVKARVPIRPATNWGGWQRRGDSGSGADLSWDQAKVRRGITTSTANARMVGGVRGQFRLLNKSAAGAVFEMAGSKGGNGSRSSSAFIRNSEKFGVAPRLLVRTWKEEKGYTVVAKAMRSVVRQAEARVNGAIK
jgi:hypothetical protein